MPVPSIPIPYPPALSHEQLSNLIFNIKDYQLTHGMLLKRGADAHSVHGVPVGVTLFPSLFPQDLFDEANRLQAVFNRLYASVSEDEEWLESVLSDMIRDDEFVGKLWKIHQEVKREGYAQDITLGVFRSDYMIHVTRNEKANQSSLNLKQIEFNTYSVAGGAHANKTAEMHQHLQNITASSVHPGTSHGDPIIGPRLPSNQTIQKIVAGLASAHAAYGGPRNSRASKPCVLFVVQPRNMNICDERPLEHALWNRDEPIPTYRVIFGEDVLTNTSTTPSRELLYHPPSDPLISVEVAVVYMRAGYDSDEYTTAGCEARRLLERSRAIKCPSILCHLSTLKKVQQELAVPEVLNRFLSPTDTAVVAKVCAPMYPLDDNSEAGKQGRALACDVTTAVSHVLKPSLEGGGHNVFGKNIPRFLKSVPKSRWHTFILMELIVPLVQSNMLLSPGGIYTAMTDNEDLNAAGGRLKKQVAGPTVSELGIFGVCMWKRENRRGIGPEFLQNSVAGWSFKTKPQHIDEMSVVKGYGCFDSPLLVDHDTMLLANT